MTETTRVVDPVRVDGPARDRRDRRRVEEASGHARTGHPDAESGRARPPRRAAAGCRRDRRRARGAREPRRRPGLRRDPHRQRQRRRDHRQPVPPHALLEALATRLRCDRGSRDHRRPRRLRQREGLPDVRVGHGAEARQAESRADGARTAGSSSRTTLATRTRTRSSASRRAARRSGCTRRWRAPT